MSVIFIPLIVCLLHQLVIMLQQLLHLSRLNIFLFPASAPGKNHLYYFLLIHKTNIFFRRTIHSEKICIRIELKSKQDGAASESSSYLNMTLRYLGPWDPETPGLWDSWTSSYFPLNPFPSFYLFLLLPSFGMVWLGVSYDIG